LITLLLLPVLILILMQFSGVQTWVAGVLVDQINKRYNIEIGIDRVSLSLNGTIGLEGVFIGDHKNDTLFYAQELLIRGLNINRNQKAIYAEDLQIIRPYFNLQRYEGDSMLNLNIFTAHFASTDTSVKDAAFSVFKVKSLNIVDARFNFDDILKEPVAGMQLDYNHSHISSLYLDADSLVFEGDSLQTHLQMLRFKEKKGYEIDTLMGGLKVSARGLSVKNATLITGNSEIYADIGFETENYKWSGFMKNVKMVHEIREATLDTKDLWWYVPELEGLDKMVLLRGRIRGPVARLRAKDFWMKWDENSELEGDFKLDGLPNFEQTFITLDLRNLSTNYEESKNIPLPPFKEYKTLQLPENLSKLGQIEFQGNFTGFMSDFVAFGTLNTAIGRLKSDISIRQNEAGVFSYSGDLDSYDFKIGTFYDINEIAALNASISVDGQGLTVDNMDAVITGKIASIGIKDYLYQNIEIDGAFKKSFFDGTVISKDENALMDFTGRIDFTSKKPIIKAHADIYNLDLVSLGFLKDSTYATITAYVDLDAEGLDPQTATGTLVIEDFSYCTEDLECRFAEININARNTEKGRRLDVQSPILEASLEGSYNLDGLQNSFYQILDQILPSYRAKNTNSKIKQDFELMVKIKDFSTIRDLFIPELDMAAGTRASAHFNQSSSKFQLTFTSDKLRYEGNDFYGLTVDMQKPDELAYITVLADKIALKDSIQFKDFVIDARSERDTIYSNVAWDSSDKGHSGEINGWVSVRGNSNFDILFGKSEIVLNDVPWSISDTAFIKIDSSRIEVREFKLSSGEQFIRVNGVLSELSRPKMDIEIRAFNLNNINPFISSGNTQLSGSVVGDVTIRDFYKSRQISSDLIILGLVLNNQPVGDFCLESSWDNELSRIVLAGELEKQELFPLKFSGYYKTLDLENPLDINLEMNGFDLSLLNPYLKEGVSELSGSLDAQANLTGQPEKPLLKGWMFFNNAGVTIDYLGTTYFLNERANIDHDMITLDYVKFKDTEGNEGRLNGFVVHNNFSDWSFEIAADIQKNRMLVLNTTQEMNSVYFGKAFATGYVTIGGYKGNLEFDINLRSESGTVISMPLGETEDLAFEDFVVFIDKDNPIIEKSQDLSGIDLNFELDITPDAEIRLIFDEAAGDVMKGRGLGHINMEITSEGKFEMYGVIEVVEGNYLFTLRNLINKEFEVLPGGSISWYGDPLAADLNLSTVYRLTAPLYDIMTENKEAYRNRTQVELVMDLKGKLLNPGITFDIQLPNSDELTKSRLRSVISTEEERNRQAFALLVLKRFVSPPDVRNEHTGYGVAENSAEFITSQFNSWLSDISEDFDVGFNYRPGDQITNNELALALSTQLFDERLRLSGNFGLNYGTRNNQNPSSLVGDIELEYDITKEGNLKMLVFNRTNEFNSVQISQGLTTQGLGIVYQEEFDNIDEFFCRVKQIFYHEEKKVKCVNEEIQK